MEPSDYGAVITINREQWRLTGLQPNRSKFPLVFTRVSDGKQLLFTDDQVDRVKAARKGGAPPPPAAPMKPFAPRAPET